MIGLEQLPQDDVLHLKLQGDWVIAETAAIKTALQSVPLSSVGALLLDAGAVGKLDVTAAWLLYQQAQRWRQQGVSIAFKHFPPEYLTYFASAIAPSASPTDKRGVGKVAEMVGIFGRQIADTGKAFRSATTFLGHSLSALSAGLLSPRLFRFRAIFHHVFATGISAVPIVALIACLISIVITYQGGGQLRDLGAEIYTVDMVAVSVLRELGVLLTAIMVAGRSGSAFAAEIGLMKINQEVDALHVMGKDPFLILVIPRLVALVIALPLLTVVADIVAVAAAALISSLILDISFVQFFTRIEANIAFRTFAAGLVKAPFFALVIALIGCWQGMRVTGSSESLGKHTTKAVVDAIFVVLMLDALFSILFYRLGF